MPGTVSGAPARSAVLGLEAVDEQLDLAVALEAEPSQDGAPTWLPPGRQGAACRARLRAPSARGRAHGRRRVPAPPAAPRRRTARPPRPCRSHGRSRRALRRRMPRSGARRRRGRIGSHRSSSTARRAARSSSLSCQTSQSISIVSRYSAAVSTRRTSTPATSGGADRARHPGQRRHLVGHEPELEQLLPGVGRRRRPAEPPLDHARARAAATPRASTQVRQRRRRCAPGARSRSASLRRRRVRRGRSSRTSAAAAGRRRCPRPALRASLPCLPEATALRCSQPFSRRNLQ